ncbi:MAG TPA: asparagine synthase (glutamine-hydrolyzing) [Candidatus Methanoperedens sp.]|nr:asparagine synthase (glutamine-hydrolyzing) [Candidatus Methanoperedens sp.]
MCGIVGLVYKDPGRPCPESVIREMRDQMIHRGPDGEGLYVDRNAGLGHRRLSIIDLSGGQQPMHNEDRTLWLVFNGEIYNYVSLRKELLRRGHEFRTRSDSEVILHLYEDMGERCVDAMNGMFAFAIYDSGDRSLFLARDRMGEKPLYYTDTEAAFSFASEIKSILKGPGFRPECDEASVPEYLMFRQLSGDKTLFKGVRCLLPGHTLVLRGNRCVTRRYWSPLARVGAARSPSFKTARDELLHLIEDSVRLRLVSDVPLGTLCSGGVDSSLVTALSASLLQHPINTFAVGFHEAAYDESRYAKLVSNLYRTIHHEIKIDNREFVDLLPRLIWHNDEPLNFTNSVHIYAVSRLAKEFVTVVLTGEGSDELMAGYPRYLIPLMLQKYFSLPLFMKAAVQAFFKRSRDHRVAKLRAATERTVREAMVYNASFLDARYAAAAVAQVVESGMPEREAIVDQGEACHLDPLAVLSLLDQHNYLVSILMRQDKMSMAASIESRVPFLDHRLVEYSNMLPSSFKVRGLQGKAILKKAAERYLPREIIYRRKSGFGVPIAGWLRDREGLGELAAGLLEPDGLPECIRRDQVRKAWEEHRAGTEDHSEYLWAIINMKLWKTVYRV